MMIYTSLKIQELLKSAIYRRNKIRIVLLNTLSMKTTEIYVSVPNVQRSSSLTMVVQFIKKVTLMVLSHNLNSWPKLTLA